MLLKDNVSDRVKEISQEAWCWRDADDFFIHLIYCMFISTFLKACLNSRPLAGMWEPGFQESLTLFIVPKLFVPKLVC